MMKNLSFLISLAVWVIAAAICIAAQEKVGSVCSTGQAAPPDVLMSICTEQHGMRSGVQRELLVRLYTDGRGEYEISSPLGEGSTPTLYGLLKKEFKIDQKKLNEIKALGRKPDFQGAKENYAPLVRKTDSSSRTTILFSYQGRTKEISLSNFNEYDQRAKSYYPTSLLALMKRAKEIRDQAVGKPQKQ